MTTLASVTPPNATRFVNSDYPPAEVPLRLPGDVSVVQLWRGDIATVAVAATLAIEFWLSYPAVILRMILVGVLTLQARAVYLPALLLCQLYASDFQLANLENFEYFLDRYDSSRIMVFGFPLTTNYIFAFCLTIRVFLSVTSKPELVRGLVSPWILGLWFMCFPVAVLASLVSLTEKTQSWSAPIRDAMMCGCLFYGIILSADDHAIRKVIAKRLMPMFFVLLVFALLGYFYARGMYWITAAGPALLIVTLTAGRSGVSLGFAITFAALTTAYAFAQYPTEYARQIAKTLYSDTMTTFALKGMWFGTLIGVPAALFLWGRHPLAYGRSKASFRNLTQGRFAVAAGVIMLMFPILLAVASYKIHVELSTSRYSAELPWQERMVFKLLYDRAPIYRGALDEVLTPPYFFKSGTRESYRLTIDGDRTPWPAGSHNLVLEELRRNGWYSGVVCLAIILGGMMWACTAMFKTRDPLLTWFAGTSFVTLLVSGVTSHIPMETNAAIWMLTPAGISAALYRTEVTTERRAL